MAAHFFGQSIAASDYHEENERYSTGANPVLAKKEDANLPDLVADSIDRLEVGDSVPSGQVFVVHGHSGAP